MNKFDLDEFKVFESIEDYDWGTKAIGVPHVWSKTMGEGVKIATIDTGCNVEHPNLQGKIASVFNMIEKSLDVTDGYGHGTHVAGLLVGNMTGVAPKSELHVMKVLNKDGIGMISHIMDGITNAINLEVDVLSISLGATLDLPLVLKQRIREAFEHGITIVSATGNNGVSEPHYPARMDEVIAVGGVDKDLNEALFSNGGYDVLAPTVDI
jgi:subtilisin family serine protease